jgi:pescadillo protein
MAEWKLYLMRSRALRKVFFSIKGVYYQADVAGETVTWLEAYGFTQHVSRSSSSCRRRPGPGSH